MRRYLAAICVVACCSVALAAEPKPVHPAAYRILVSYDEETLAEFREHIAEAVEKALAERARRLERSRGLAKDLIKLERERYRRDLAAVKHYREREVLARSKGEVDDAERWRLLRVERLREALDLARRAQLIEQALLAKSLQNWRLAREQEKAIADKALKELEAALEKAPPPATPPK
jgi:hypothetical protein